MKKSYTIKDIAELAKVSTGTVDRVIHKRGRVSKEAFENVTKILNQIDYKPNLIARNLKKNKNYTIAVLLPDYNLDNYWTACFEGIEAVKNEFIAFNIQIKTILYNPKNINDFIDKSNNIVLLNPDAVLMAPLFKKQSNSIINTFVKQGIKVSIINNNIKNHNVTNFVGQDLVKSGRIAAKLFDLITKNGKIIVLHIGANFKNATYFQEKEKGFYDFLKENNSSLDPITFTCSSENLDCHFVDFLKNTPNVKGVFVTNSKTHKAARIFEKQNIKNIKLIGYDLIEENIHYLKNNTIQFLIYQNAKHQIFLGLSNLIEYFLFDKQINSENLLPINIINSENLESYTQKEEVYE